MFLIAGEAIDLSPSMNKLTFISLTLIRQRNHSHQAVQELMFGSVRSSQLYTNRTQTLVDHSQQLILEMQLLLKVKDHQLVSNSSKNTY